MKLIFCIPLFFCLNIYSYNIFSQCQTVVLVDSSFEASTLYAYSGQPTTGVWFYDDGCDFSTNAYTGDHSACSNGGGAFQFVSVDPQTTYYLSAYIYRGDSELSPFPMFRINWQPYSFTVPTEDWTFVSQSFNSGDDTLAIIGFYSMAACFDDFRVTCDPVTGINPIEKNKKKYVLQPNISSHQFKLDAEVPIRIEIWGVNGQLFKKMHSDFSHTFGEELPKGLYLLRIKSADKIWMEKIIKA